MSDAFQPASTGEAHDYDDATVDNTSGGVLLLEENPARLSAMIQNIGSNAMRVTTDGSAPTATHGKQVVGGAALVLSSPNCPTGPVKAIREGGSNTTANASEVD